MSVHLEAKTARLALLLAAGGAEVCVTGSNSLSTQDDVAAGLVASGLSVLLGIMRLLKNIIAILKCLWSLLRI